MLLPEFQTKDLVEQALGNETLLYDLKTNRAYSLNETATIVYRACDGKTPLEDLAEREKLSKEIILLSLKQFEQENLIGPAEEVSNDYTKVSRRELVRKIGVTSLVALPFISTIFVPTSLHAASGAALLGAGGLCNNPAQCQSGSCIPGFTVSTPPDPIPPICFPGPSGFPPFCTNFPPNPGVPVVVPPFCS